MFNVKTVEKSFMNRLSHSSATKFMTCPTAWRYHYKDRLRSKEQKAALLFGSAIDTALQDMLKHSRDPVASFSEAWKFAEVNGKKVYLPTCTEIVYSNSDFDKDLLTIDDLNYLGPTKVEKLFEIIKKKEEVGFHGLEHSEKEILNDANWLCLNRKGLLMIKAVQEKVLPNVEEVLGVQEYVTLENSTGDSIIGYADLVCRWKGLKYPVVFDFKTSSIKYDRDSVLTSPQLTLYVHALEEKFQTRLAGFIVLQKRIQKNKTKKCSNCKFDGTGSRAKTCTNELDDGDLGKRSRCGSEWIETLNPEVEVDIIINEIPQATEDLVIENLDYINTAIKTNSFHRNLNSCVMAWGKCEFYNKCYKGDDSGLIVAEERKK
jgi:hypothetical protein